MYSTMETLLENVHLCNISIQGRRVLHPAYDKATWRNHRLTFE